MLCFCLSSGNGQPRLGRLCLLSLALLLMVVGTVGLAIPTELPLCAEIHGFAGEINDKFSIPVETAPADGEAIVLIARAYPTNLGSLLEKWLYISARYHLAEGPVVTRTSDSNGLLELPNIAANTEIEVQLLRVRADGPVPFRFFSFFANKPVCHVSVSAENTFLAPVPHRLAGSSKPVTMYFKTPLPLDMNAAYINIVADARTGQSFSVMDKDNAWQSHSANDLIQTSTGGSIAFSFSPTPDDAGSVYCFTSVSVSYATAQGVVVTPTAAPLPGGEQGSSASPASPPQGGTPATATNSTAAPASSTSMSLLRRLIWVALLCFVAWQAALATYNFRVLGKRDVMDIIPCAETVAAGARGVQLAASRGLGKAHRRSDGYDSVQGMNDPYA